MTPSFSCLLPLHRGGRRRPESLADAPQDWSTSEAWWPWRKRPCSRTVRTENICRRVQERLQHRCRYRGHCRSGPRHLSPWSRVCAQKWFCKDIHSHIHSHPPMHTLLKQTRSKTLYSPNMSPSFSCPFPVQCAGGRRPGSLADECRDDVRP